MIFTCTTQSSVALERKAWTCYLFHVWLHPASCSVTCALLQHCLTLQCIPQPQLLPCLPYYGISWHNSQNARVEAKVCICTSSSLPRGWRGLLPSLCLLQPPKPKWRDSWLCYSGRSERMTSRREGKTGRAWKPAFHLHFLVLSCGLHPLFFLLDW